MRSTNQTSGHQTSNHQPSSAGLFLFECATRIEGVQPTRSSAGLLLIECATRIEGVQPTTVCGSASFGAQAISTRLSCCQLGLRNWQIHIHRAQGVRFATDTRTLLLSPVPGPKLLKSLGPETGLRRVRFCYSGQHTSFQKAECLVALLKAECHVVALPNAECHVVALLKAFLKADRQVVAPTVAMNLSES